MKVFFQPKARPKNTWKFANCENVSNMETWKSLRPNFKEILEGNKALGTCSRCKKKYFNLVRICA